MERRKFYQYATFFLLALNLAMVAFFLLGPPPPQGDPARHGLKDRVAQMLRLDDDQAARFGELAEQHNRHMEELAARQRTLLKDYFLALTDTAMHTPTDSLLQAYLELEREKVTFTYRHFQDVQALLRPEQQPLFRTFVREALRTLLLDEGGRPPQGPPEDPH